MSKKILFVIKEREVYGTKTTCYGLVNSCQFVANVLNNISGYEAKVVQVVDNNAIDKEVFAYKPTYCFIEALWVTPAKFKELAPLHPGVKWVVRLHSMIPFLVSEGMSFDWVNEYQKLRDSGINISVSCNNNRLHKDLNNVYKDISYSPNIYYPDKSLIGDHVYVEKGSNIVNVGCFGALRMLKNHCQQAFWAIEFADKIGKNLNFHVNVSDHETDETSPVLKNLHAIFKDTNHKLIEHIWMPHEDFVQLIRQMDFGLQISFTETFNIVAADFVSAGVPVIVSNEIDFINPLTVVNPSLSFDIKVAMYIAYYGRKYKIHKINNYLLDKHNKMAIKQWLNLLV